MKRQIENSSNVFLTWYHIFCTMWPSPDSYSLHLVHAPYVNNSHMQYTMKMPALLTYNNAVSKGTSDVSGTQSLKIQQTYPDPSLKIRRTYPGFAFWVFGAPSSMPYASPTPSSMDSTGSSVEFREQCSKESTKLMRHEPLCAVSVQTRKACSVWKRIGGSQLLPTDFRTCMMQHSFTCIFWRKETDKERVLLSSFQFFPHLWPWKWKTGAVLILQTGNESSQLPVDSTTSKEDSLDVMCKPCIPG